MPTGAATKFAPATRQRQSTPESQVFGSRGDPTASVEHTGAYTDANFVSERGANYLRFRNFKDQKMTGGKLDASELPTFGALNPDLTTASEASASTKKYSDLSPKEKAEKAAKPTAHLVYGENYYGNLHFVLKRSAVGHRLVYTSSDHGRPRRNPLLVVHDALSKDASNFTGLGGEAVNVSRTKLLARVFNASAANPQALETDTLPFEIQIFGAVDIATDVERIYVAESASATELANLQAFASAAATPIPVTVLTPPPHLDLVKANTVTLKASFPPSAFV
jgi:hypothetical protein